MREELLALRAALETVFREVGEMLEQAGVMLLEEFSDRFSDMALKTEIGEAEQS